MKKLALALLCLALGACANKHASDDQAAVQSLRPDNCSDMGTGTFYFADYGPLFAKRSSCTIPENTKATCDFFETPDGIRQMQCTADGTAALTTVPSYCHDGTFFGVRYFFQGSRSFAAPNPLSVTGAWDCGMTSYNLRCWLYQGTNGSTRIQDLLCVDNAPVL